MNVSAKKRQISVISALTKGANKGSVHHAKTLLTLAALSIAVLTGTELLAAQKPDPAGIVDLPSSINAGNPIGSISDHPWQNVNVDGMRIRLGWKDIETADGVYDWSLIDDCVALAAISGKFIGVSVFAGTSSPPWLMGADTFTDGTAYQNGSTITSFTANFVASDVGRVIVCDKFPLGTTIISQTSTVANLSAAATANRNGNLTFSILGRHPGVPFRVLTAPDAGAMPIPWDPIVLTKWTAFVAAFGARYDGNSNLLYVPMGGLGQSGESRVASAQDDIDYFEVSAVAAGYTATVDYSAAVVGWMATAQAITAAYMAAFPTTPPFFTGAAPFGSSGGGSAAMQAIVDWGVATYPGRFGIMNAQLNAVQTGGTPFTIISSNAATQPTGIQFLCSTATDDLVARLSLSPPYGDNPLLSAYDALNNSFTIAVNLGCKFAETYEDDVNNTAYQTMLATQGAALRSHAPIANLVVTVTDGKTTAFAGTTDSYTIVVTNPGPSNVTDAVVKDNFPGTFTGVTFSATQSGGASGFTSSGSGNISDKVTMPADSSITYIATGTISAAATGTLSNTATVTVPSGVTDPDVSNNSAKDTDTITVKADVKVTVTDGKSAVVAGQKNNYTITVTNSGPSNANGVIVRDSFPSVFTGVTFTATQTGGASGFTPSGSGNISDTVTLPASSHITYKARGTISASAHGTISDTATVTPPSGVTDSNLANNSWTDTDTVQ
jgi:uncharacterized repeat protein (TIGR01451 family)